jgi:DNA-binding PadR family transcriptional regulator
MPYPDLSRDQVYSLAILNQLEDGEAMWGKELRGKLGELGRKKGKVAFYEFMRRMEATGLVERSVERRATGGPGSGIETKFAITPSGREALIRVTEFYQLVLGLVRA